MTRALKWSVVIAICLVMVGLCACGSSGSGQQGQASSGGDAAGAQAGSMQAVHTEEAWTLIEADPSKKACLSCHPRDVIVDETKDYLGEIGVNPHASHTESYDCTKCHSMSGMSVLVCNTACHGGYHGDGQGWPLPDENWQNPTDELPAADGVAISTNVQQ